MPYTLTKTNGTTLTIVQDGTVNEITDLVFVGKNFVGYGDPVNENFVKLLENFSNITAPLKPLTGQIWFDSGANKLKFYNGKQFKPVAAITTGTSTPANAVIGDLHFNGSLFYAFTGNTWLPIGPLASTSGGGTAALPTTTIISQEQTINPAISLSLGGNSVGVLSTSSAYAVFSLDGLYSQYRAIYPGINLPDTNSSGISGYYDSGSNLGNLLWGTAASAIGLVDYTNSVKTLIRTSDIVTKNSLSSGTNSIAVATDDGITINDAFKLHVTRETGIATANISNIRNNVIKFNINTVAGTYTNFINFDARSEFFRVLPNPSIDVSLGSSDTGGKFANIYGTNLYVTTVTATTINGTSVTATTISASSLTVSGSVTANAVQLSSTSTINGARILTTATLRNVSQLDNDAGYLTPGTVGGYGVSSVRGTTQQISVSSTTGNVTLSLPSIMTVGTMTAVYISATDIFMNGSRVLTSATVPSGGIVAVNGTDNQITANQVGSSVTLSLPAAVQLTSLSAAALYDNGSRVLTEASAVRTFSPGQTGFTPAGANTGDIVLGGSLSPSYGGTGITPGNEITGIPYGNGTGALTRATAAQIVSQIGSTAVNNSTNAANAVAASTQANTDKSTNIATTNFVHNIVPYGTILMWYGSTGNIPSGWRLCDGQNGTPNLLDKFMVAAGSAYGVGSTGGSRNAVVVAHTHVSTSTVTDPGHQHDSTFGQKQTTGPFGNVPGILNNGFGTNAGTDMDNNRFLTSRSTASITVETINASTGVSGTDANLPPYYAICYIMKTTGQ